MSISIQLPQDTEYRLEALVARTGRAKLDYLRDFIEQGLEEAEDYDLATLVLERVRRGDEPVHSASDVRKELGLDD